MTPQKVQVIRETCRSARGVTRVRARMRAVTGSSQKARWRGVSPTPQIHLGTYVLQIETKKNQMMVFSESKSKTESTKAKPATLEALPEEQPLLHPPRHPRSGRALHRPVLARDIAEKGKARKISTVRRTKWIGSLPTTSWMSTRWRS